MRNADCAVPRSLMYTVMQIVRRLYVDWQRPKRIWFRKPASILPSCFIMVAKSIKVKVTEIVNDLKSKGVSPCLATVLVGENTASATYVRNKHKACEEVGILTKDHTPSADITQEELNQLIEKLNDYKKIIESAKNDAKKNNKDNKTDDKRDR